MNENKTYEQLRQEREQIGTEIEQLAERWRQLDLQLEEMRHGSEGVSECQG